MFHYHIYRVVINAFKQNIHEKAFYSSKRTKKVNNESLSINESNEIKQNDLRDQTNE